MQKKSDQSDNPRAIAWRILCSFQRSRLDARELLDRALVQHRPSRADAGLARELTLGILRHRSLLDDQISPFLKAPIRQTDQALLNLLRLGFYQHYLMDRVPPHALVDECVQIAKVHISKKGANFINGVLRNLLRQNPSLRISDDPSIQFSHPRWLVELYKKRYGDGLLNERLEWNNRQPDLHLRVNTLKNSTEQFASQMNLVDVKVIAAGSPAPESVILQGSLGALRGQEWFGRGLATPQDAAAQLIAHFCQPESGERIIDWCSAPGGKTSHLAELIGERSRILALDVVSGRLERVEEAAGRLDLKTVETRLLCPELIGYLQENPAELVLVDAPCTGLGTLRRNPDIRWRRKVGDPAKLQARQLEILQTAAQCVASGGRLVYCVCTFSLEECEGVAAKFLKQNRGFSLEPPTGLPEFLKPFVDQKGFLRTESLEHNCDTFFAARFRRELFK